MLSPLRSPGGVFRRSPGGVRGRAIPGLQGAFNGVIYGVCLIGKQIICVGNFTKYGDTDRVRVARLNSSGTLDTSFDPGTGTNGITQTAASLDNKIIIAGAFTTFNGDQHGRIAQLNADGSINMGVDYEDGFNGTVFKAAIDENDKVVCVGGFTGFDGTGRNRIARLNTDGTLDTSFNPGTGFNAAVYDVAIDSSGKMICVGAFWLYDGTWRGGIARINTDGTLDTSFSPAYGFDVADILFIPKSVAIGENDKIVCVGYFKEYNGVSRGGVVRINTDGTLDTSFNPGTGFNAFAWGERGVEDVAIDTDGKVVCVGNISSFNGATIYGAARLNADGTRDTAFNNTVSGTGYPLAVVLDANGKLVCGGSLISYGGQPRSYVVRINSDGSRDDSFMGWLNE